jgi:hypothetical protein
MGGFSQQKAKQRQPHSDENNLAVSDFPRSSDDHQLCSGVGKDPFQRHLMKLVFPYHS